MKNLSGGKSVKLSQSERRNKKASIADTKSVPLGGTTKQTSLLSYLAVNNKSNALEICLEEEESSEHYIANMNYLKDSLPLRRASPDVVSTLESETCIPMPSRPISTKEPLIIEEKSLKSQDGYKTTHILHHTSCQNSTVAGCSPCVDAPAPGVSRLRRSVRERWGASGSQFQLCSGQSLNHAMDLSANSDDAVCNTTATIDKFSHSFSGILHNSDALTKRQELDKLLAEVADSIADDEIKNYELLMAQASNTQCHNSAAGRSQSVLPRSAAILPREIAVSPLDAALEAAMLGFSTPRQKNQPLVRSDLAAVSCTLDFTSAPDNQTRGPPPLTESSPSSNTAATPTVFSFCRMLVLEISYITDYNGEGSFKNPCSTLTRDNEVEKVLRLFDDARDVSCLVLLRGDWVDTNVKVGDYVNLVARSGTQAHAQLTAAIVEGVEPIVIGNRLGGNGDAFLVLHPDTLVSGSNISDSFKCKRRVVLSERLKLSDRNPAATYGSITHDLFQSALRERQFSDEYFQTTIENLIVAYTDDLYAIGEKSQEVVTAKLKEQLPLIQAWARKYMRETPLPTSRLSTPLVSSSSNMESVCVSKVLDIEENIWSPTFGMKGKVDASVELTIQIVDASAKVGSVTSYDQQHPNLKVLTVPFELKTGKVAQSLHSAQVMVYSLLMSERYNLNISSGVLYYSKSSEVAGVASEGRMLESMIMARNDVAAYLSLPPPSHLAGSLQGSAEEDILTQLPPLITNLFECRYCFQKSSCALFHIATEGGTSSSSGWGAEFDEMVGHLKPSHLMYFRHWNRLIDWERTESEKFRSEIWRLPGKEREKRGRCLCDLTIIGAWADSENSSFSAKMHYTFARYPKDMASSVAASRSAADVGTTNGFLSSSFCVGDMICVSTDTCSQFSLARGSVTALTLDTISVAVDRELRGKRWGETAGSKTFENRSTINSDVNETTLEGEIRGTPPTPTSFRVDPGSDALFRWRIDKDESLTGFGTIKTNLIKLMVSQGRESRLRDLIIDLQPPKFHSLPPHIHSSTPLTMEPGIVPLSSAETSGLNRDQISAATAVLAAKDFALILGMPGTGKTTTIAIIVKMLVARHQRVLLCAYTHSAVDNILLKLREHSFQDFVRIGNEAQVHPDVRDALLRKCSSEKNDDCNSYSLSNLDSKLSSAPVIAVTCLGVSSPLLSMFSQSSTRQSYLQFDYVIIDEASQVTQPVCLGPLRLGSRFVLVGDHYQLPPLVRSEEARVSDGSESLFKRLSEAHPGAVSRLSYQYRMNSDIMLLSNTLVYSYALKCGTYKVATTELRLPKIPRIIRNSGTYIASNTESISEKNCWIADALHPSRKVLFIDTDALLDCREGVSLSATSKNTIGRGSVQNGGEARIVALLISALASAGVPNEEIGVMSPFRAQIKLILSLLPAHLQSSIESNTVDKYQGRDKACVILSLVRSNEHGEVGGLLRDWRRVNVALTRAKCKLLIIGHARTLKTTEPFLTLIEMIMKREWLMSLPSDALDAFSVISDITESTVSPINEGNDCKRLKRVGFDEKQAMRLASLPIFNNVIMDMESL